MISMEPFDVSRTRPYYETRADGWPLCPCCGEDELWSTFYWDGTGEKPPIQAWIDKGLVCYNCQWDGARPRPIIATATQPPPVRPPITVAPRFVRRYGYLVCVTCGLAKEYCGCAKTPPPPPHGDGVSSDLIARIRDARSGR